MDGWRKPTDEESRIIFAQELRQMGPYLCISLVTMGLACLLLLYFLIHIELSGIRDIDLFLVLIPTVYVGINIFVYVAYVRRLCSIKNRDYDVLIGVCARKWVGHAGKSSTFYITVLTEDGQTSESQTSRRTYHAADAQSQILAACFRDRGIILSTKKAYLYNLQ